jgi:hypothetical protein
MIQTDKQIITITAWWSADCSPTDRISSWFSILIMERVLRFHQWWFIQMLDHRKAEEHTHWGDAADRPISTYGSVKRHGSAKYNSRTKFGRSILAHIFARFDRWTRGEPVQVLKILGVPLKTSLRWSCHWLRHPTWRSYRSNWQQHCRMFANDQETELAR